MKQVVTFAFTDDIPKNLCEENESSEFTSHPLSQPLRYTGYQNQKGASQAKNNFFPTAANTEHDIAHNTKTTDNTGLTNILSIKHLDIMSIRTYFRSRCNELKAGKLKHYFLSRKS